MKNENGSRLLDKEELSKLTEKIENTTNKINDLNEKKEIFKSAKGGFINSFGMMSVIIIYVSLLAFFMLDIIPSYISGFLALILNTIAIVLFAVQTSTRLTNVAIPNSAFLLFLNPFNPLFSI